MSEHHCHAIGCTVRTHPKFFMCRRHWFMVPRHLRDRIWATYVPGQEVRKDPTVEYLEAAERARLAVFRIEYGRPVNNLTEAMRYIRELKGVQS